MHVFTIDKRETIGIMSKNKIFHSFITWKVDKYICDIFFILGTKQMLGSKPRKCRELDEKKRIKTSIHHIVISKSKSLETEEMTD